MEYYEYLTHRKKYQEDGVAFLLLRKHACLYYKPGKGKTYPCIEAMRDVDKTMDYQAKCLVLSTADAINNMWKYEIVPQNILPKNTTLMTFTSAIQEKRAAELLKTKWDVIVVDECHKVKSNSAKISKLTHKLTKNCKYVWGLSGTPRGNSDLDIYCQFHNLNICEWGTIAYSTFVNNVCEIDTKFFNGNKVITPVGIKDSYRTGWENNIAMYTQRIDYCEEDNMPELNVDVVKIPYKRTQKDAEVEKGVLKIGDYATTLLKLSVLNKLHQLVNGFMYYSDEEDTKNVVEISNNAKLDWLRQNLTDRPTLVVYMFEYDREMISKALFDAGISFTSDVTAFKKGGTRVLLLQCSRCESFNLQMCRDAVFYTMDYSFIKYDQMLHRIWRTGQTNDVNINILVANGTCEEDIWNAVKCKQDLSNLFMQVKERIDG